jgi:hypothetical protein
LREDEEKEVGVEWIGKRRRRRRRKVVLLFGMMMMMMMMMTWRTMMTWAMDLLQAVRILFLHP